MTTSGVNRDSRPGFARWRFAQLTAVTLIYLLVAPRLDYLSLSHFIAQIVLLNTVFVTISAYTDRVISHRMKTAVWCVCAISFAATALERLTPHDSWSHTAWWVEIVTSVIVQCACVAGILVYIVRSRRITLDNIFAAIVTYILIGTIFALVYLAAWNLNDQAFSLPSETSATADNARFTMVYFSFVTLATLGYGDILAVDPLVRMIAVIEAMVGQFYVAVLVGVLVGLFVSHNLTAPEK